ncbi:DUF2459 domain-containing protein [Aquimarina pacifica]|uniref:DUF2459 domain-containing protein n=1 Tax=Aquimarina pacifica TaxID=1296415 RepID=UPI001377C790|nr:DUF2459 domain-containing protein [Aquimarina pacifica]
MKKALKYISLFLLIPLLYLVVSLSLSYIPINGKTEDAKHIIYLSTNGVHLDIIIPKNKVTFVLPDEHTLTTPTRYYAFGWGDRTYYTETPVGEKVSLLNGCKALFVPSPTLIHVTKHLTTKKNWVEIKVGNDQLKKINQYINDSFRLDDKNQKIILYGAGYTKNDVFYEAIGTYTCFKTCNSWVNTGLKQSNIKASLWTPFDFGLLYLHKK